MVNLLIGQKGSGKTQKMIDLANEKVKDCNGNVVFIKKTHRDTASVSFDIRTICLDDIPAISNTDAYIGFLYGMSSANHDIECVFIDALLKHADVTLETLPSFVAKLNKLASECDIQFYVSVSADPADVAGIEGCNLI
jgi:hypothetical protein